MSGTLDLSGYKLTFDDEFNSFNWNSTATPGNGTWQTTFYFGGRSLSSNGEQETYSDPSTGTNPFSINQSGDLPGHSQLNITAQPNGSGGYTSGLITTEPSFSQTYGYFEMRAELPAGKGLWPAFWMLPTDKSWPPEIDALEAFGAPNANGEGGATSYHYGAISGNGSQSNGGWLNLPANTETGYHNYGVMWDPQHLTYYFDGQEVAQVNTPADMNKPMYMLANLAVAGNWPGAPDGSTNFPADMKVDYIRAFSDDPNATAVTPQAGYDGPGAPAAPTAVADASSPSPSPAPSDAPAPAAADATASPSPSPTPAPTPAPTDGSSSSSPSPTPAPTPAPTAGDGPTPTPQETHASASADATGTATGDATPTDLTATADSQTLVGNGGDDVFQIGNFAGTGIVETGHGISEVDTSAAAYVLPAGISNLVATDNGNHVLTGNGENNVITGGAGNDVIDSGGGTAILTGGGGSDTFVMNKGYLQETITDFHPGTDTVQLNGYGLDSNAVTSALSQHGADTWLTLPDGGTVVFQNTTVSQLTPSDFTFDASGASTSASASPSPSPSPAPSGDTPVIANPDAHATPQVAHISVTPDGSGTATGTSQPSVLEATGTHQSLVGNGGNDIFLIGDHTDATVSETGHGTATVVTSGPAFTLPTGVDNLIGTGNGAQTLSGNAGNDFIQGNNGSDVIHAGSGNDTIAVGTGTNNLTGGAGQDLFVFSNAADHGNEITNFTLGHDELDLTQLMKSINYHGQDPVADHVLQLVQSGNNTNVVVDPHGNGGSDAHTVVTLDNVVASSLKPGHDVIWHS